MKIRHSQVKMLVLPKTVAISALPHRNILLTTNATEHRRIT